VPAQAGQHLVRALGLPTGAGGVEDRQRVQHVDVVVHHDDDLRHAHRRRHDLATARPSPGFCFRMLTKPKPGSSEGVWANVTLGASCWSPRSDDMLAVADGLPRLTPVNWLTIQGSRRCVTRVTFIQKFSALALPM